MHVRFSYDKRFDKLIEKVKHTYGEEILTFSGIHPSQLDMAAYTRDFLFNGSSDCIADQSVDSNANVDDRSVVSFDHEVSKAQNKLNALNMIWDSIIDVMSEKGRGSEATDIADSAIEDIISCALYLNDSHYAHKAYCYSFDLFPLVNEGLPFVRKIHIGPPQHFNSMIDLVIQATAFISNQIAGAASFPNLLIYLDYFTRKDYGEEYWKDRDAMEAIEQGLQSLVYSLNYPFRGSQSAFTNLSIYDRGFLEELFSTTVYPDGSSIDMESVEMLQRIFIDWFNRESEKQVFTFPVLTANLVAEDGVIEDTEFLNYVSEVNLKFGILNIYTGPATCLSSCCRLRSSLIHEHTNSLGTGSVSIGSHRVCTINLPRVAIEADYDRDRFMNILDDRLSKVYAVLDAHRAILQKLIANGRLPLYTYGWMDLNKQYSTVGLLGPYEACKFMGLDITTDEGTQLIIDAMDYINMQNSAREAKWNDGRRYNLELIPGEQAAIKICQADKMLFPSFRNPYTMYSNQFIPLIEKCEMWDRMKLQGTFDSRAQGGCIMHINVDHQLRNATQMRQLIEASTRAGAIYYAVNYNIARCSENHVNVGKTNVCHVCGRPIVSNMTRVVGFMTDVSDWHMVRRDEYQDRHFYDPDSEVHTDLEDVQLELKVS